MCHDQSSIRLHTSKKRKREHLRLQQTKTDEKRTVNRKRTNENVKQPTVARPQKCKIQCATQAQTGTQPQIADIVVHVREFWKKHVKRKIPVYFSALEIINLSNDSSPSWNCSQNTAFVGQTGGLKVFDSSAHAAAEHNRTTLKISDKLLRIVIALTSRSINTKKFQTFFLHCADY